MRWRPSTSDHVRARAICPTAAAAWLSSSLSGPGGSLSTARPSAIAPDETTSTSRLSRCRAAMSSASAESQSSCSRPPSLSTRSDEPTFTTMRRKSVREGAFRDMFSGCDGPAARDNHCRTGALFSMCFRVHAKGVTDDQGGDDNDQKSAAPVDGALVSSGLSPRRAARGRQRVFSVINPAAARPRPGHRAVPHAGLDRSPAIARATPRVRRLRSRHRAERFQCAAARQ